MIVIFRPDKMTPSRKGEVYFNGVKILPGTNTDIPAHRLEQAQKSALFQRCLTEWQAIELVEADQADPNSDIGADLRSLAEPEARRVIESTFDLATLDVWKRNEKRRSLLNALQTRINDVTRGRG
jgi:hypothetical protein